MQLQLRTIRTVATFAATKRESAVFKREIPLDGYNTKRPGQRRRRLEHDI
jgi:hypothetical protein